MSEFQWTKRKTLAAMVLAEGYKQGQAAAEAGVSERTIGRWLKDFEFSTEVDRLTLLTGIATRAERMRITKQVIAEKMAQVIKSDRDALDWLKFAQSETDGAKLDLAALLGAMEGAETGGTENRTGSGKAHGGTR